MAKLKTIMVGVGHDHAHDAFKCITRSDSPFELAAIVLDEKDNGNYDKFRADYDQYPHISLEDALEYQRLDCVIVESDDSQLTRLAIPFARKGVAIHMDKPGGQDEKEFEELVSLCGSGKDALHLGYMYRYNPAIKEAIRVIKGGLVGQVYTIDAQMSISHPESKLQWLSSFKGGMMNFLGCHLVDLILQIQGKPDSVIPYNSISKEGRGEDLGFALLRYGNHVSQITSSGVELDGFSRRHVTIVAEKMTIDIAPTEIVKDGKLYSVATYKAPVVIDGTPIGVVTYGPYDRYVEMFDEFASIVKGEINNPYTPEYEQLVHEVLLAVCGEFGKEKRI